MFQFAQRHVQQQHTYHDVIHRMPGVVHAFRQKEDDGRTLEQGGEHVRKVVVNVGETAEVFAAQSLDMS